VIDPTNPAASASQASTRSSADQGLGTRIQSASELRMDFLNLLTAQLSNQDPLSPMDNEQMVQQLATFSQLEQLERVNSNLQEQMGYSQSLNNTMMMNVAGKRVTVAGNEIGVVNGQPSRSLVRVPEAGTVFARVLDANGATVRTLDANIVEPGFNRIEWDGKDDNGNAVPDGDYSLEISAVDRSGNFMKSVAFSSGVVDTVQFENNFIQLEVNGRLYGPGDVVEVGVAPRDPVVVNVEGDDGPGTGSDDDDGTDDDGTGVTPPPDAEDPWSPPVSSMLGGASRSTFDRNPWEALLRIG